MRLRAVDFWADGGTIPNRRHLFDRPYEVADLRYPASAPLLRNAGPVFVRDIDPDFAVAVSGRWMMGPEQLADLHVAPCRQEGQRIEQG